MPPVDLMAILDAEFRQERSDAFGRIGRKLQAAIDETRALAERLEPMPPGASRTAMLEHHREARQRVDEFRFYLVVQREAIGLMEHSILDEVYPVPRAIKA